MTAVIDYVKPVQILEPDTGQGSAYFYVGNGCNVCLRINTTAGGGGVTVRTGEEVLVYYFDAYGNSKLLIDAFTGQARIGPGENAITIASSGQYLAVKSVTAEVIGLEIIQNNQG